MPGTVPCQARLWERAKKLYGTFWKSTGFLCLFWEPTSMSSWCPQRAPWILTKSNAPNTGQICGPTLLDLVWMHTSAVGSPESSALKDQKNAANILITYLYWYGLNSSIWRFIRNTYGESPSLHSHAGDFPLEKTQNLAIQNAIEDVSSGVPWVSNLCDRYHPHQTLYQRCFIFFHGPTTFPLFIFLLFWLRLVRFGKPPAHQGHHMFLY